MFRKLPMKAPRTKPINEVQVGKSDGMVGYDKKIKKLFNRPFLWRNRWSQSDSTDSNFRSYLSSASPEDSFEITSTSGRKHETTMNPTMNPRPTIMIGSMAAVNEASVASTSLS